MPANSAIEFIRHTQNSPELQAQIATLQGRDALERLILTAQDAGFVFTEEEYRAAVVHEAEGELDDAALDELAREVGFGRPHNEA